MSNKVDTVTGVADGGQTQVPKVRFPKFRDAWQRLPMNQVYRFKGNNPFSRDQLNYDKGDLKTIHYGDIHTKFSANFRAGNELVPFINRGENHSSLKEDNWCSVGDIVFADASEDMNDIGKAIEIIDAGEVPLTAGMHTILARPELHEIAVGFGCYMFASRSVRQQIQREAQGAKVLGISPTRLGSIKLPIPIDVSEQRRIADCLSSLDDLILAEEERLAALIDYKKGLVQQLFPRPERIENGEKIPAETTPRLRFPEFQDAGEWVWTTVDAIAKISKGKGIAKADIVADGQRPCVRYGELYTTYGEVIDDVISRTNGAKRDLFMSRANDVIIPSSGETKIDIATAACVLHDDIALGGDLNVIRSAHDGIFLSYFFNGPLKYSIAKVAQGDSVVHLYPSQIGTLNIAIPSADEQKRIADTMFAVDRALVERRHQIVALKAHKSGLMQQLFPSPVERGA